MSALARCLLAFALAVPAVAVAGSQGHTELEFDAAVFAEQKDALVKELRNGERYSEITSDDKAKVVDALNRMQTQLASVTAIDQLDPEARNKIYNDQELINTILTQAAEDSRVVCSRETPVGSHRQVNICKTVAQRRLEREAAQNAVRRGARSNMRPPQGG